jgi:hypothetical protein
MTKFYDWLYEEANLWFLPMFIFGIFILAVVFALAFVLLQFSFLALRVVVLGLLLVTFPYIVYRFKFKK